MQDFKLRDEEGRLAALHRYGVLDSQPDDAFDQIIKLIRTALGVPMAGVSFIDRDHQRFIATDGMSNDPVPRDESFCTHAIERRRPMVIGDATQDRRLAGKPKVVGAPHIRSYLGVPLETPDGFNIGTICAIDTEPRGFTAAQVSLMESLATLAMEQMELRQIAKTDQLTGALTRRGFMAELTRDFARSSRYDRPAALVFLDIDHFKSVNDTYGHPAGDEVLRTVAEVCMQTLRQSDVLGRLGGEEFGLLLPETDAADAMACAERLRALVEALVVHVPESAVKVTVSCGVAPLTPEIETEATWFAAADVALYQAKRGGRNRCVSADPRALTTRKRGGFTERQTDNVVRLRSAH